MFSGILGTTTTNNSSSQVQPPSDPISNDDSTEGLDGLALDVVNIKNLFRAKLAEISGVINNDAENINKYVEQIKGIIGKNNSAKEKIQELKELMEKFSEVESYKNSRVKMDEAMKALDSSINSTETNTTPVDNSSESKIREQAKIILKNKGIALPNDQLASFINTNNNLNPKTQWWNNIRQQRIDVSKLQPSRQELISWKNANNLRGGYLSNSRKLRRPSRRNTRDFFKFTRKSGESLGAKRMRKSRKKRRGRK
tara:strand:- start:32 stop:796 length:765 start_codon:yes stop_codon:yes gene_type:complete